MNLEALCKTCDHEHRHHFALYDDDEGKPCRVADCLCLVFVAKTEGEDQEDGEGNENGSWCSNSRLWLALRGFTRPSGCPNQKQYEESACRGCGYFEIREVTPYVRRGLKLIAEAYA